MSEFDYYSVMKHRIEYFARKYDPYNRLSIKEEKIPQNIPVAKPKRIRQRISAGYSSIISLLF